jgi:predicted TIM-barrel fold metal-dependent hydrolase
MIDTHVHVWTMDTKKYPFQQSLSAVPIPKDPAKIEDFIECMQNTGVKNAVLVQPSTYGWDNSYLCDCIQNNPGKFAGVCLVDPKSNSAADDLVHWCDGEGCQGLRINLVGYSEAEFLLEPEKKILWDTISELKAKVSFQMMPNQSYIINALAKSRPEITFIIDQVGAIVHRNTKLNTFVEELSERPNIYAKLNSVGQNSVEQYPFKDLWPFFKHLVDSFGPNRIMYGTDFPHTLKKCCYTKAINWLYELPFVGPYAQDAIESGTAQELWRFDKITKN